MGKKLHLAVALSISAIFAFCPAVAQSDYVCGDANGDGQLNVGDAVFMISYIFKGGLAPDTGCCEGCSEGATRLCYTGPPGSQGVGQCAAGIQTCVGGEWGPCVGEVLPSAEICDGYDNDCDGIIDNGFNVGEPCSAGIGECEECGVMVCRQDGTGTECSAVGGVPTAEVCDGLDNDCDGVVDNGFNIGEPCSAGIGECEECGVMVCRQDGSGTECSADPGVPTAEVCDGLDNDCDGTSDEEDPGGGDPCNTGMQGVCQDGTTHCQGGQLVCVQEVMPSPEICDGLDNDCDGAVDEGNPEGGGPCSTGMPGVCAAGTLQCQEGQLVCVQDVMASPEVCDGLDNDCDGQVDEGNPEGGDPCSTGMPGVCAAGTLQCQGGALACVQNVMPSAEVCDGLDNDCDGMVDEGNPGGGSPCNTGMPGVCAAGTLQCQGGALVCVQNVMPSAEICNDNLDNDCDGLIDAADPDCP